MVGPRAKHSLCGAMVVAISAGCAASATPTSEGGCAGLLMRLLYAQGTSEPVNGYILMGWIEPAD